MENAYEGGNEKMAQNSGDLDIGHNDMSFVSIHPFHKYNCNNIEK